MNGRVLVLCASRDRNIALERMRDSVNRTSTHADIAVYVDDDQQQDYLIRKLDVVGPRIGPVASLNHLWKLHRGYDAYGAATDDSEFLTPGWDRWVLETASNLPGRVGFISPYHGVFKRMDFPWMTARTAEVMGYFAYPTPYHFFWDVYMEVVGRQTVIRYATKKQFEMSHDAALSDGIHDKMREDAFQVVRGIACHAPGDVERLKLAMER